MGKKFLYDVYMLCPVRGATDEEKDFLERYKRKLEEKGFKVQYPATDTNQEDSRTGGYRICMDHCNQILKSKAVHVYWNGKSQGSYVDLGTTLGEHSKRGLDVLLMKTKPVREIVKQQKESGITKSYEMVLLRLNRMADKKTKIKIR